MKTTLILKMKKYPIPIFIPVNINFPEDKLMVMTPETILHAVLNQTDYLSSDNFDILDENLNPISSTKVYDPGSLDSEVTVISEHWNK